MKQLLAIMLSVANPADPVSVAGEQATDALIDAKSGKAISMDYAGLRRSELYIEGATVNGAITIANPYVTTTGDALVYQEKAAF